MNNFRELAALAAGRGSGRVIAVAGAADHEVLEAIKAANLAYGVKALLFGRKDEIEHLGREIGLSPDASVITDAIDDRASAALAAKAVAAGEADILMKGNLSTSVFMKGILHQEGLVAKNALLSHVMFYEVKAYPKLIALTDGGLIPFPDVNQKTAILRNAISLLRRLGYESITAAVLSAVETVSAKIPSTVDADRIASDPSWRHEAVTVFGPVGLDLAISKKAVKMKQFEQAGAGDADILLVPSFEVGNGIGKALTYFADADSAGLVVGAACPIVLVSRADDANTKLRSIALALAAGEDFQPEKQTEDFHDETVVR